MITITPNASAYIKKQLLKAEIDLSVGGMRFGIKAGGCSGFYYFHEPAKEPRENDNIIETDGIRIFIDPKSMNMMDDVTIDRADNLIDGDFFYSNPQAKSTCGCSISFGT